MQRQSGNTASTTEPSPCVYMIDKGQWGSYAGALEHSVGIFASRNPHLMAAKSGTVYEPGESLFSVPSFGQELSVTYPGGRVTFSGSGLFPTFPWCLCVINYLARSDGTALSHRPVSYRELKDGSIYYQAFRREAINLLARWVGGKSPDLLARAAEELGGEVTGGADFALTIPVLPRFPMTIKLWFPDEELEGSANILFDSTANHYLHTEDIAVIGELAAKYLVLHYQMLDESQK